MCIRDREDRGGNLLTIRIGDNGRGMSPEFLKKVIDPFVTTRTTRKVGMGIPLFKEASEECGGSFTIQSALGKGTEVTATFQYDHIDRQPLGDMAETVATLVSGSPLVDFVYTHKKDVYKRQRYDKGEADYLNCPMTQDEYERFYRALVSAETAELKECEKNVLEGCRPVEAMARRGEATLLFGPRKPVGLDVYKRQVEDTLFECISAFATVGLSTGITPHLSAFSLSLIHI